MESLKVGMEKIKKFGNKIYHSWYCMMNRCYNSKNPSYQYYGLKGIKVCEEWHIFENFYKWAMEHPREDGMTLDRIETNRDYEPSNCRWATPKEQTWNRECTIYYSYHGETKTLSEWAEIYGMPYSLVYSRYKMGWSEDAMFTSAREKSIPDEVVDNICKEILNNVPKKEIAKRFGVHPSLVSNIANGKIHTDVSSKYGFTNYHEEFDMEIIDFIKKEREKQGLSYRQLAEKADLSPRAISYMEQGRYRITVESVDKVLKALGVTYTLGQ